MPLSDIQRDTTFTPILRIATAAIIAGLIVFATSAAAPDIQPEPLQAAAKSDRLPLPVKGSACSQHGWPDFEQYCQFDFRSVGNDVRTIRIIALR